MKNKTERLNREERFQLKINEDEHKFQKELNKTNLEKEKFFQIKLALFVFLLTISSSVLTGVVVYNITSDKEPYLIVSPYKFNVENDTFSVQIANIKEIPAMNVRLVYHIEGSMQKATAIPVNIPYLKKDNIFVEISIKELNEQLKNYCKIKLEEENDIKELNNFSIHKENNVILEVSCDKCDNQNVLENILRYSKEINCSYGLNNEINYQLEKGSQFS